MKNLAAYPLILALLLASSPARAAAPAPAIAVALSPQERADLSLQASLNPWLQKQSAGELVLVEQDRRHWHRGYSYGLGGLILTALIVTLIVVGQPDYRR